MIGPLRVIADHLLSGFRQSMMDLVDTSRIQLERTLGDSVAQDAVDWLCTHWEAELSDDGICKNFVFINHQWVVKLGENAVNEAELYEELEDYDQQHLCVPTVRLGGFGCLQVKVTGVYEYMIAHDNKWDELWDTQEMCDRRAEMSEVGDDNHMDNMGFIDDQLYLLDFGGATPLADWEGRYNNYGDSEPCSCRYCRPDLYN